MASIPHPLQKFTNDATVGNRLESNPEPSDQKQNSLPIELYFIIDGECPVWKAN